jgi:hypothetical protein
MGEDLPRFPNAVRVYLPDGEQIGYLNSELADEVAGRLHRGWRYRAFISEITGGVEDAPTYGVNLLVVAAKPKTPEQEFDSYVTQVRSAGSTGSPAGCASCGGCCGLIAAALLLLLTGLTAVVVSLAR